MSSSSDLVPVHGGLAEPVDRTVPVSKRRDFSKEAVGLPKLVVSAADLSLFANATSKSNGLGETPHHIASSAPVSDIALEVADYGAIARVSFATVTFAAWTASVYNTFSLNAAGLG